MLAPGRAGGVSNTHTQQCRRGGTLEGRPGEPATRVRRSCNAGVRLQLPAGVSLLIAVRCCQCWSPSHQKLLSRTSTCTALTLAQVHGRLRSNAAAAFRMFMLLLCTQLDKQCICHPCQHTPMPNLGACAKLSASQCRDWVQDVHAGASDLPSKPQLHLPPTFISSASDTMAQ